eukprot:scaffold80931_cov73-Cyclotella_meneghiniana.AAC.3
MHPYHRHTFYEYIVHLQVSCHRASLRRRSFLLLATIAWPQLVFAFLLYAFSLWLQIAIRTMTLLQNLFTWLLLLGAAVLGLALFKASCFDYDCDSQLRFTAFDSQLQDCLD